MKYRVTVRTSDDLVPREYVGKYASPGDAVFGAMRKDEIADRERRRERRKLFVEIEPLVCRSEYWDGKRSHLCRRDLGHKGDHMSKTKRWERD